MSWWLKLIITIALYLFGYWSRPHVDKAVRWWNFFHEDRPRMFPLKQDEVPMPKPTDTRRWRPRP